MYRVFLNSIYDQLSQSSWPLKVKRAQLLTTELISSNGIMSSYFKRCLEISWKRKFTDINVPEQERNSVIPRIVQGIFLFCRILEKQLSH